LNLLFPESLEERPSRQPSAAFPLPDVRKPELRNHQTVVGVDGEKGSEIKKSKLKCNRDKHPNYVKVQKKLLNVITDNGHSW
jgi:hypothetical protein